MDLVSYLLSIADRSEVTADAPPFIDRLLENTATYFAATGVAHYCEHGCERAIGAERELLISACHTVPAEFLESVLAATTPQWTPARFNSERHLLVIPGSRRQGAREALVALLPVMVSPSDRWTHLRVAQLVSKWWCLDTLTRGPAVVLPADIDEEQLLVHLFATLDEDEMCFSIANEARRCLDVDRCTVLTTKSRHFVCRSVSGVATVDRRSNAVRRLETLVTRAMVEQSPFVHPATGDHAPQIETALLDYLEACPAKAIHILPLRAPGNSQAGTWLGALVVESFMSPLTTTLPERLATFVPFASRALWCAHEASHRWPWKRRGEAFVGGRRGIMLTLGLMAVLGLLIVMCTVHVELNIAANGELQPVKQQRIFARVDGIVKEVHAEHGHVVKDGDLLLLLENAELERQLQEIAGKLQTANQRLTDLQALRLSARPPAPEEGRTGDTLAAEQQQLRVELENLTRQQQLLSEQQAHLRVTSPTNGTVISWDVRQRLVARPVSRGQEVLTIADLGGDWELDLQVADHDIAPIITSWNDKSALDVEFLQATEPDVIRRGVVATIADTTQYNPQQGNTIRIVAHPSDDATLMPRAGAAVQAKIRCGKQPLGYVLFRDLWRFIHTRIIFPWR